MEKIKNIALTGGSTWWHIFPLLALYNYLRDNKSDITNLPKYKFIWVGEEDSLEEEITRKYKIKFLSLPAGKIRRYFDLRNFYEPLKNLTWIVFGIYYIKKHKIDIVFSKWWYVSLPLCIAATLLRKKIYVHESDAVWGLANRIISKLATKVFYTFPNKKINDKKHILSWQILNPEIIDYLTSLEVWENEKLNVIATGWSQGSTAIFTALLKILPELSDINFQIVLWQKNGHFRDGFKKYPNTVVHDFLTQKRLWKILKDTDIAITRAWATSLWELNMFGIHSLIIPLKGSAWNHQYKNAEYFHKMFGSDILQNEDDLAEQLLDKLQRYKNLRKSWLNLDKFFDALRTIEEEIEKI
jgi:UDP-N-acetylglucosamine--N-acetylmuramyl-(pentapeptide) pyrophosphoryl-undecaprenol N-acetylglucosamine transferase